MKVELWDKENGGYITDELSSVDIHLANSNEENRIKWTTDLAAISRGKYESKNPEKRYHALMKEAALATPSRPFEFLPVVIDYKIISDIIILKLKDGIQMNFNLEDFTNSFGGNQGYLKDGKLYTNMRAVLNAGIEYEFVPYNTPAEIALGDFKAFRAKIPMWLWAQVPNTHTFISKEAQSDRVAEETDYWLPVDFREKVYEFVNKKLINKEDYEMEFQIAKLILTFNNKQDIIEMLLNIPSQKLVQRLFKLLGYKREIYSRALYYFKYKEVVMTGWNINPKVWRHLFIERSACPDKWKNWTQEDTAYFVKELKDNFFGNKNDS